MFKHRRNITDRDVLWGLLTGDKDKPVRWVPVKEIPTEQIVNILDSHHVISEYYRYIFEKELEHRRNDVNK